MAEEASHHSWVKMIPWIVAVFSGSAGGAITASALSVEPLSVNSIIETETRVLSALEEHGRDLARIYGALGALDDRQREMHTNLTELRIITHNHLQRNKDASR